jgi:hypothetical protein
MRLIKAAPLLAVLGVFGCRDIGTLQPDFDPRHAVSSGISGTNPYFSFATPLWANTAIGSFDGSHLSTLKVQICRWHYANASEPTDSPNFGNGQCDTEKNWTFTATEGPFDQKIVLQLGQHYQLSWNTTPFNLEATRRPNVRDTVRVQVFIGNVRLGFADGVVGENSGHLNDVNTNHFFKINNGETIPIRWVVNHNALCPETSCTTTTILANGEDQLVPLDGGGAFLMTGDGSLKLPSDATLVEESIEQPLLPTTFRTNQQGKKLNLIVDGELPTFELDDWVIYLCLDPTRIPGHNWVFSAADLFPPRLWGNRANIEALEQSNIPGDPSLCAGYALGTNSSRAGALFARALRLLERPLAMLMVTPLHAQDQTRGFTKTSFTHFAFVEEIALESQVGDLVVVPPGDVAHLSVKVVVDQEKSDAFDGSPVEDEEVRFDVYDSNNAFVIRLTDISDGDGIAAVAWNTMGVAEGEYRVVVTTKPYNDDGSEVSGADPIEITVIVGTLVPTSAVFGTPLGTVDPPTIGEFGAFWGPPHPVLRICHVSHVVAGACTGTFIMNEPVDNIEFSAGEPLYYQRKPNWNSNPATTSGEHYQFEILLEGELLASEIRMAGPTGNFSGTFPIKFVINLGFE